MSDETIQPVEPPVAAMDVRPPRNPPRKYEDCPYCGNRLQTVRPDGTFGPHLISCKWGVDDTHPMGLRATPMEGSITWEGHDGYCPMSGKPVIVDAEGKPVPLPPEKKRIPAPPEKPIATKKPVVVRSPLKEESMEDEVIKRLKAEKVLLEQRLKRIDGAISLLSDTSIPTVVLKAPTASRKAHGRVYTQAQKDAMSRKLKATWAAKKAKKK